MGEMGPHVPQPKEKGEEEHHALTFAIHLEDHELHAFHEGMQSDFCAHVKGNLGCDHVEIVHLKAGSVIVHAHAVGFVHSDHLHEAAQKISDGKAVDSSWGNHHVAVHPERSIKLHQASEWLRSQRKDAWHSGVREHGASQAHGLYGGHCGTPRGPRCQADLAPPAPVREFCELSELAEVEAGNAQLKHDVEQLRKKLGASLGASLEIAHSHCTTLASTPSPASPASARRRLIDSSSPNVESPWTAYPFGARAEVDVQNTLKHEITQMRERLEQQRLKQEINAMRERIAAPHVQPAVARNAQLVQPTEPIAVRQWTTSHLSSSRNHTLLAHV